MKKRNIRNIFKEVLFEGNEYGSSENEELAAKRKRVNSNLYKTFDVFLRILFGSSDTKPTKNDYIVAYNNLKIALRKANEETDTRQLERISREIRKIKGAGNYKTNELKKLIDDLSKELDARKLGGEYTSEQFANKSKEEIKAKKNSIDNNLASAKKELETRYTRNKMLTKELVERTNKHFADLDKELNSYISQRKTLFQKVTSNGGTTQQASSGFILRKKGILGEAITGDAEKEKLKLLFKTYATNEDKKEFNRLTTAINELKQKKETEKESFYKTPEILTIKKSLKTNQEKIRELEKSIGLFDQQSVEISKKLNEIINLNAAELNNYNIRKLENLLDSKKKELDDKNKEIEELQQGRKELKGYKFKSANPVYKEIEKILDDYSPNHFNFDKGYDDKYAYWPGIKAKTEKFGKELEEKKKERDELFKLNNAETDRDIDAKLSYESAASFRKKMKELEPELNKLESEIQNLLNIAESKRKNGESYEEIEKLVVSKESKLKEIKSEYSRFAKSFSQEKSEIENLEKEIKELKKKNEDDGRGKYKYQIELKMSELKELKKDYKKSPAAYIQNIEELEDKLVQLKKAKNELIGKDDEEEVEELIKNINKTQELLDKKKGKPVAKILEDELQKLKEKLEKARSVDFSWASKKMTPEEVNKRKMELIRTLNKVGKLDGYNANGEDFDNILVKIRNVVAKANGETEISSDYYDKSTDKTTRKAADKKWEEEEKKADEEFANLRKEADDEIEKIYNDLKKGNISKEEARKLAKEVNEKLNKKEKEIDDRLEKLADYLHKVDDSNIKEKVKIDGKIDRSALTSAQARINALLDKTVESSNKVTKNTNVNAGASHGAAKRANIPELKGRIGPKVVKENNAIYYGVLPGAAGGKTDSHVVLVDNYSESNPPFVEIDGKKWYFYVVGKTVPVSSGPMFVGNTDIEKKHKPTWLSDKAAYCYRSNKTMAISLRHVGKTEQEKRIYDIIDTAIKKMTSSVMTEESSYFNY